MAVNAGRHGHPFFKSLCEFALRLIAHIQRNGCDRLINSPLDETLIPFQSCIQGYGYEVNEYSKKDYTDGLLITARLPSLFSALRIMPSLTIPFSLRGARLAMKQTCLPTSSSG